jgi:hypothetical protein
MRVASRPKRRFKFELLCLKLEAFDEAIKEVWVCDQDIVIHLEDSRRCLEMLQSIYSRGVE